MHFSPKTRIIVDWVKILIGLVICAFGVYLTIGIVEILPWAVVTLIGWMIGCNVGIGTIIFVFGAGALMHLFFDVIRFEPRKLKHKSLTGS